MYLVLHSPESSAEQTDAEGLTGIPVDTGAALPSPQGFWQSAHHQLQEDAHNQNSN